jgi:hypothetical protein
VHQFVHDAAYATAVLNKARDSIDPRLREYAIGIEKRMLLGPRSAGRGHAARALDATGAADPARAGRRIVQ